MRKIFIVLIMLIASIIPKGFNGDINYTNDEVVQNTIPNEIAIENLTEEVIANNEITENIQENKTEEINTEQEITESIIENNSSKVESTSKQNVKTSTKVQEQPKIESVIEHPKQQEQTKKEVAVEQNKQPDIPQETPKQNNIPVQKALEPKKEEVQAPKYCVEGGAIHLEGDGAGEHGYYNSWNEAFDAMNSYTAVWETFNYKIAQCPCGKYYFKVTK